MKRKIFLFIILILLFIFGVLIYDFSDEMDKKLTDQKWYSINDNEIYELSLSNNKFTLTDELGNNANEYESCNNYQYNSNVSMIKLNCNGSNKKIYITSYNNKLVLNDDNQERIFYSSKEIALIENFKEENNLSDQEYDELLSLNFKDDLFISYQRFLDLYKGKNSVYIGIITNNINYDNVYNYQVLNNLINSSSKDFYLINVDSLNESELLKLNKITNEDNYSNKVNIYEVKKLSELNLRLTFNNLPKKN